MLRKSLAAIIIIIFLCSLLPMLAISIYNHPSADDYSYGWQTVRVWRETGSVAAVIIEAVRYAVYIYKGWQGSFSAVFLMSLQPAIFNASLYFITSFIMLTALTLSTLFLFYVIIVKMLKADKLSFLVIGLAPLALAIQLVPSPVEAYFWFNGSIYYNFFYAISLTYFALILKGLASKKISIINASLMFIASVAVGGSNYTTALLTSIIGLCLMCTAFLKRHSSRWVMLASYFILLISFAISALSPGNSVRQAGHVKMTSFFAILSSFSVAFDFIVEWTTIPVVLLFVMMFPVALVCVKNTSFNFKLPGLVTAFSLCLFSAQFTPPLYSMSYSGPLRLINIIYFSYYQLIMLNIIYYAGYFRKRFKTMALPRQEFLFIAALIIAAAFAISCYTNRHSSASYNAIAQLRSGEAYTYHKEQLERLELYTEDSLTSLVIKRHSARPSILFFDDITTDPSDWRNGALARYYGKEFIVIDE